jgi:hypothetical protein
MHFCYFKSQGKIDRHVSPSGPRHKDPVINDNGSGVADFLFELGAGADVLARHCVIFIRLNESPIRCQFF